jgi:hypothetical protein
MACEASHTMSTYNAYLNCKHDAMNRSVLVGACKQVKQVKPSLPASLIVLPNAVSLRHACTAGFPHCNAPLVTCRHDVMFKVEVNPHFQNPKLSVSKIG